MTKIITDLKNHPRRLALIGSSAVLALAALGYVGATDLASSSKPVAKAAEVCKPAYHTVSTGVGKERQTIFAQYDCHKAVAPSHKSTTTSHKAVPTASHKSAKSTDASTPSSSGSTKLTAATFMGRWADLTKGPSLVTTGSIILSWNGSGATATPGPTAPITLKIDGPSEWSWNIPRITFPGGHHHAEVGTATPSGATAIDIFGGQSLSYHYGPNDFVVVTGVPLLRYSQLQGGRPFLSLASPTVVSTNSTGWNVRFVVVHPYCYTHLGKIGGACSSTGFSQLSPQAAPQTLPSTVTLSVTPAANNGLNIQLPPPSQGDKLPTGTINIVEPPNADGASGSAS